MAGNWKPDDTKGCIIAIVLVFILGGGGIFAFMKWGNVGPNVPDGPAKDRIVGPQQKAAADELKQD